MTATPVRSSGVKVMTFPLRAAEPIAGWVSELTRNLVLSPSGSSASNDTSTTSVSSSSTVRRSSWTTGRRLPASGSRTVMLIDAATVDVPSAFVT